MCSEAVWFLRLTHTRLADSIMEVCGIPQKESARKACLQIFTRFAVTAPGMLPKDAGRPQRNRSSSIGQQSDASTGATVRPDATSYIDAAVESRTFPETAANRLRLFLSSGCCPLPADIDDALNTILVATGHLRQLDAQNKVADPRRLKRYEDISRIVQSLKNLVLLMKEMGIGPILGSKSEAQGSLINKPMYIALDLGLRQKRKHFNGQIFFQAIVLPDNFFDMAATESNAQDKSQSIVGQGTKVAEGGRYDELVCIIVVSFD